MTLPAKQRRAATHATSRQTNTGALALHQIMSLPVFYFLYYFGFCGFRFLFILSLTSCSEEKKHGLV